MFWRQREALDGSGDRMKGAEAKVAGRAHGLSAGGAETVQGARRRRPQAGSGGGRRTGAAQAGPCQIPRRAGTLDDDKARGHGLERIAFEVATVEGAAFGGLAKIASGGELARFSLALKVALAQVSSPAALVFDEVDRGVGGAVADAVGERLQRLAETTQVLLVTHSPQVAARAARHFRISRVGDKTRIVLLEDDARLEEIARMLSGANVTDEARAAAKRLVAEAAHRQKSPANAHESRRETLFRRGGKGTGQARARHRRA